MLVQHNDYNLSHWISFFWSSIHLFVLWLAILSEQICRTDDAHEQEQAEQHKWDQVTGGQLLSQRRNVPTTHSPHRRRNKHRLADGALGDAPIGDS